MSSPSPRPRTRRHLVGAALLAATAAGVLVPTGTALAADTTTVTAENCGTVRSSNYKPGDFYPAFTLDSPRPEQLQVKNNDSAMNLSPNGVNQLAIEKASSAELNKGLPTNTESKLAPTVQVQHTNGTPWPCVTVTFTPQQGSWTFADGTKQAVVIADADGVATAPHILAGDKPQNSSIVIRAKSDSTTFRTQYDVNVVQAQEKPAEDKPVEKAKPAPGVTAFELSNWANSVTASAGNEVKLPQVTATFDGRPANDTPVKVKLENAGGAAFQTPQGPETTIDITTNDKGVLTLPKLTAGSTSFTIHLSAGNGYGGQANQNIAVTVK